MEQACGASILSSIHNLAKHVADGAACANMMTAAADDVPQADVREERWVNVRVQARNLDG